MLCITRHPFHLCVSDAFSGKEDKNPNIITKDAPNILIADKIPRVCFGNCEPGYMRPKIYANYNYLVM